MGTASGFVSGSRAPDGGGKSNRKTVGHWGTENESNKIKTVYKMKKRNPNRRFTRRRRSTFSAELIRCGDAAAASNRRRSLLFGAVFVTQKKKKTIDGHTDVDMDVDMDVDIDRSSIADAGSSRMHNETVPRNWCIDRRQKRCALPSATELVVEVGRGQTR